MNSRTLLSTAFGLAMLSAGCGGEPPVSEDAEALRGAPGDAAPRLNYAKTTARRSSTNMTYHSGALLAASKTMAIFWGSEWSTTSFQGDKVSGLDSFFTGFGGSRYAAIVDEYSGGGQTMTSQSTYLGHTFDPTAAPKGALTTTQAVTEACKITGNNPDPKALYLIYTSTGAGNANYCAWHSWGSCGSKPIQVAYMPNLDGVAGCNPSDTWTTHSEGLSALANVTAHELEETITDPQGTGWYDGAGSEIGDKCAWSFNAPVTFANGSTWKLQEEWSNKAYSAGTGLANLSGQKGCAQGN
jgi:hypothetical protein